jgi:type II secretory pathway pseudopilin PulG
MSASRKVGFTIIEIMLFLAVTGFLIAGILIGTGNSINIQRYRDSVSSFQAFFQSQYSEIINASNDKSIRNSSACSGSPTLVGQSDCELLGRLITTTDGKTISVQNIIGKTTVATSSDDITALNNYTFYLPDSATPIQYSLEWGASVVYDNVVAANAVRRQAMPFSVLILRSPSSEVVRTFIKTGLPPAIITSAVIKSYITSTNLSNSITMCVVDPSKINTAVTIAQDALLRRAVKINASSTSANGVELLTEGTGSGC